MRKTVLWEPLSGEENAGVAWVSDNRLRATNRVPSPARPRASPETGARTTAFLTRNGCQDDRFPHQKRVPGRPLSSPETGASTTAFLTRNGCNAVVC